MAKGGKKGKNKIKSQAAINNASASSGTKSIKLTEKEQHLLELAKQIQKDSELDLAEFKKLLEEDYANEYEEKKAAIDEALNAEMKELRAEYEEQMKEDNKELIRENTELISKNAALKELNTKIEKMVSALKKQVEKTNKEQQKIIDNANIKAEKIIDKAEKVNEKANAELEKTISELEKQAEKTNKEQQKIIDDANIKAKKIIDKAKKDAEKANKKILADIKSRTEHLDEREEAMEDKEFELESKESLLSSKERRLKKQAEIYDTANLDVVESLKSQLTMREELLESVQKEYAEAQRELNKIRLSMIHTEGISPEELQKTNEQLYKRIEELENKCNRYTEEELNEMKAAFDSKDNWLMQIRNLTNEVSSNRLELTRVNNSIQEYEQLKAQMDLLRTLNEHLRGELDNTKKMLESSVGEICPALTSIDIDESVESGDSYVRYEERLANKNDGRIKNLYQLVEHVRNYAASREKPLFYSRQDLKAFIAGLAASPFTILQGMSGTGKTSLPKIFCEAILGEINVVPVESSWRDRNELLGYYNDFSKKFTAKEFTCNLYRAGCTRYDNTIYFIVLDEMNLSRIEYYFADFLSVLENKKDKWLIKLVDTDMRQLPTEITNEVVEALARDRSNEGLELRAIVQKLYPDNRLSEDDENAISASDKLKLITYLSNKQYKNAAGTRSIVGGPQNLINGNTIRIPQNVWFIGTANRDESTFEITDKVYDRAQVLNFNNRAKGSRLKNDMPAVYITYRELQNMFEAAKRSKNYSFDSENCTALQEIESVLKSYFRISYGNRIQDQMNTFVPVYVAAGSYAGVKAEELTRLENEAIDYQLTNKVLRKLEYEDINDEAADKLKKLFEKYGLEQARDFINWKTRGAK